MPDMEFFFEGYTTWYWEGYCIDERPKCTIDFYNKHLKKGSFNNSNNRTITTNLTSFMFFGWDFAFNNAGTSFRNIN